jgi:hypothetical protein
MPPTLTNTSFRAKYDVLSTHKAQFYVYNGPASYVAGGDPLSADDVGLGNIDAILGVGVAWNGSAVRLLVWDKANQKMLWYVPNTGSEATGDLSAYAATIVVLGS